MQLALFGEEGPGPLVECLRVLNLANTRSCKSFRDVMSNKTNRPYKLCVQKLNKSAWQVSVVLNTKT